MRRILLRKRHASVLSNRVRVSEQALCKCLERGTKGSFEARFKDYAIDYRILAIGRARWD